MLAMIPAVMRGVHEIVELHRLSFIWEGHRALHGAYITSLGLTVCKRGSIQDYIQI